MKLIIIENKRIDQCKMIITCFGCWRCAHNFSHHRKKIPITKIVVMVLVFYIYFLPFIVKIAKQKNGILVCKFFMNNFTAI